MSEKTKKRMKQEKTGENAGAYTPASSRLWDRDSGKGETKSFVHMKLPRRMRVTITIVLR